MFYTITFWIIRNLNWVILLGIITRSILLWTKSNGKIVFVSSWTDIKLLKCLFYSIIKGAIFIAKFYPLKGPWLLCNCFRYSSVYRFWCFSYNCSVKILLPLNFYFFNYSLFIIWKKLLFITGHALTNILC